jgi:hypothetical protein
MTQWTIPKKPRRNYKKGMPSVTTVLKTLGWNRDALMGWANKIGREGLKIHEARDPKADVGSLAHHLCECFLGDINHQATQEWHEATEEHQRLALCALDQFKTWWAWQRTQGWEIEECEIAMESRANKFCGTADLILRDPDGAYIIADIKTGSPHPEAAIQMAAYASLYHEETARHITEGLLLHIPTDGRPLTAHHITKQEIDAGEAIFFQLLDIERHRTLFKELGERMKDATPSVAAKPEGSPF